MISNSKMETCSKCSTKVLKNDLENHEAWCKKKGRRSVIGKCSYCQKQYKVRKALEEHEVKCQKNPNNIAIKKPRRKSINPHLRMKVWETYIGKRHRGKCFCCNLNEITPFTYCNTFQAGHIISHANGGKDTIGNLIPICRDCNMNMGAENWDDYVDRNPQLPLRRCGNDPPIIKYIKGIVWCQSLVRMWLERKKPDSEWRIQWLNKQ